MHDLGLRGAVRGRSWTTTTQAAPTIDNVTTAMTSLALLLKDMKLYADAAPLYERAQAAYECALGPDHPYVAYPVENLGGPPGHR
jgi:hypothetical protein